MTLSSRMCSPNASRSRQSVPKGGTSDRKHKPGGSQMRGAIRALAGAVGVLVLASQVADAQILFWSTQAKPVEETQRMRDQRSRGVRGRRRLPAVRRRSLADAHSGRARRRARARSGCSAALHGSFASMPDDLVDLSGDRPGRPSRQRGLPRARHARHRGAEVPAVDAGDLHHGRQQEGAGVPAGRRRHQRAHLRPAVAWSKALAEADRLAEVRLSRPGPRG